MFELTITNPKNMSKRQRNIAITAEVLVPGYLQARIDRHETVDQILFVELRKDMVNGKIAFNPGHLATLMDKIDRARWASPPRS